MALATLTKVGRSAIAKAIMDRDLHIAWGSGLAEWDVENATLPSLVDRSALYNELGRRITTAKKFVEPDSQGDIAVPIGINADGTAELARYKIVEEASPYIYVRANFDFDNAPTATIREMGIFMDTVIKSGLPAGQQYFTPTELDDAGMLLAMQIITPKIARNASIRQTVEFVLPI